MKTLLKTIAVVATCALSMTALAVEVAEPKEKKSHKVVIEVTADDAEKWEGTLRNVENVQKSLGVENTKITVVAHGKGIGMLLRKSSDANAELKGKLAQLHDSGVVFAACENTMKRMKLEKSDLVELSTTVDSGVSEVIRKQEDGFAYIKSGG